MIAYTSFSFFLLYFGITFIVYSVLPQKRRWVALLIGSYVFYFISAKGHVLPMVLCTVLTWGTGVLIQQRNDSWSVRRKQVPKEERKALKKEYERDKRMLVTFGVLAVAAILLVTKYSNFLICTANNLFSIDLRELPVVQTLGTSFFVLQGISYIADVYYGRIRAEQNPLRVSLYLSFLLTVVEGPIARYDPLGLQLQEGRVNRLEDISKGFMRVLWGLFKKVVIADRAAILANAVFDNYEYYSGLQTIAGIAFYTLQLYCEFSGIMDVVIGLGAMLGLRMPENFRQPFFAKSINEFWQRWHITLGTWLRDYVFYSVSLSKSLQRLSGRTRARFKPYYATLVPTSIALFFVWFTNGFWHGAAWKYIAYGLYYYVLMMLGLFLEPVFRSICQRLKIDRESGAFGVFQAVRTVIIANVGMLIFRASSLKAAGSMFCSVFRDFDLAVLLPGYQNGFSLSLYDYAAIAVGTVLLVVVSVFREKGFDFEGTIYRLPYVARVAIYSAMLLVIIVFGAYGEEYGVVDLIYAGF